MVHTNKLSFPVIVVTLLLLGIYSESPAIFFTHEHEILFDVSAPTCEQETCRQLFTNVTTDPQFFQRVWASCQCEDRFCRHNNTGSPSGSVTPDNDRCREWSHYGIDTLLRPIEERDECNENCSKKFLPDPYWDRYQFTDYFKQRTRPVIGDEWDKWTCPYPGSLLDKYHKKSLDLGIRGGNFSALYRLIKLDVAKMAEDGEALPRPNTLVIHLRLGDVIDASRRSVHEMLSEQTYFYHLQVQESWNAYVKPLSYWADILMNMTDQISQYSSVVIMGTAHKGQQEGTMTATKSCKYTKA
jgi:hypothetical protein